MGDRGSGSGCDPVAVADPFGDLVRVREWKGVAAAVSGDVRAGRVRILEEAKVFHANLPAFGSARDGKPGREINCPDSIRFWTCRAAGRVPFVPDMSFYVPRFRAPRLAAGLGNGALDRSPGARMVIRLRGAGVKPHVHDNSDDARCTSPSRMSRCPAPPRRSRKHAGPATPSGTSRRTLDAIVLPRTARLDEVGAIPRDKDRSRMSELIAPGRCPP